MAASPVLVVGATGTLGGMIARRLLAGGTPVRAFARSKEKLAALAGAGADVIAADLRDLPAITAACRGVSQIVATANNNMGKGPASPMRVDVAAYQNLCAAARNAGVARLIFVSFRGITSGETVDIFRVKWYIEDAIRRSGVPHVMLRPSALLDVWIDEVLMPGVRKSGVATVFASGDRPTNYIAADDVASFALAILSRPDVRNEIVDAGGPTTASLNALVSMLERQYGKPIKRRHVPMFALNLLPAILRPFNEVAARMVSIGHFTATQARPFPEWAVNAERFGVRPRAAEQYVAEAWPRLMAGAR